MIIGIGVDVIEIDRIKKACQKKSFVKRVFTDNEVYINRNFNSFAGNFAVKEAVAKAFGTGVRHFSMTDIEVLRNQDGMPYVILYNNALKISSNLGIKNIFVSISHSANIAIGFVIAEG